MKKIAVILVICFITALFVSACSQKSCPAYTKAETSQTENNG
jgi:ABC-type Fe3+-citrate transport system substrate-binding protein